MRPSKTEDKKEETCSRINDVCMLSREQQSNSTGKISVIYSNDSLDDQLPLFDQFGLVVPASYYIS